ncbi:serine hydrolase FSH [Pterulicium gracile]|uniref:Serine hydrolase FSH n=1 Tax=Pterulicium gracile TaxID=1884261 RepID=A0A5C3QMP5_9AGAR|nr:serine hydrolase FSH [Pterula gracilis]
MSKRTILVLHGYTQSAATFSKRLGFLRKASPDLDFVFLDGPTILLPADLSQFGTADTQADINSSVEYRAWWRWKEEENKAIGLDETLLLLKETLQNRKFDGVLGFSQGAALAALLAALLERPHIHPPFLVDGNPPHPPFDFCVAVAGFRLRDPIADAILSEPFNTRTLHVLGRTDIMVPTERARHLLDLSANSRLEEHDGGHFLPSKTPWRKFMVEWIKTPNDDVPSPSAAVSGTSTPVGDGTSGTSTPLMKL